MEILKKLNFCNISFSIKPVQKLNLSNFIGATLRGGFGYSFKNLVCINKTEKNCKDCSLNFNCPYFNLFEPQKKQYDKIKISDIPRPYVMDLLMDQRKIIEKDQKFSFNLILIGEAIKYFPYFYFAFTRFGERGIGKQKDRFIIDEIKEEFPEKKILYKNPEDKLSMLETKEILWKEKEIKSIKINFLTPTKLKINNKYISNPDFSILMESIFRRIYFLLIFWCGIEMKYNFKDLIKEAKNIKIENGNLYWKDFERFSTRQKTKMKLGGIMGEVEYSGDIKKFYPYLKICEYIHIGKNTTFGLGKYVLE